MPFASGSEIRRAFVAEVTPGTTPSTPTFKVLRATTGNLRANKGTKMSAETQRDRNVRDEFVVSVGAGGQYGFELSYGSLDDIFEAVFCGAWASDVLVNGVARKYMTFEETMELGATDSYARFPMGMVDQLELTVDSENEINGNFTIMASDEIHDTAIISGATYTAPNTNDVMVAGVDVGTLDILGLSPAPKIKRISLTIANGLRRRSTVSSQKSEEFGWGKIQVTGSFDAYFDGNALWDQVKAHGKGNITIPLGSVTGKKYEFYMPAARLLDGARQIGGNEDDVMMNVPFRALYDGGLAGSIRLTRAIA